MSVLGEVTFFCPPAVVYGEQQRAAQQLVRQGKHVVFHAHALGAVCAEGCWES